MVWQKMTLHLRAKIPGLSVIARTSSLAFRGNDLDLRCISEALAVGKMLEGSAQPADRILG